MSERPARDLREQGAMSPTQRPWWTLDICRECVATPSYTGHGSIPVEFEEIQRSLCQLRPLSET